MSTRASILIKEKYRSSDYKIFIYHHCDGYPSGIGVDMKNYLTGLKDWEWDADSIANGLLKGRCAGDMDYEISCGCVHSDEEYLYLIDCPTRSIHCYKVPGWGEADESLIGDEKYEVEIK